MITLKLVSSLKVDDSFSKTNSSSYKNIPSSDSSSPEKNHNSSQESL